ncbi:hypothetical protein O3M35_012300 [Rhynocoris fuscipes]|uniref:Transmembrane protein 19 n=1 Tax=Rhynocoris fuscipes TaxID=488301 RepID=A0AAW1CSN8_9HEMI
MVDRVGYRGVNVNTLTPVFLLVTAIPVSMFMWVGNIAFSILKPGPDEVIPPTRWLAATLIPLAFAAWGLRKGTISKSGALLGFIVGFILTLASYCFLACLIVFFVTSSKAAKFKDRAKKKLAHDFKEGAQRNWIQVLCNGGMAAQLALLYLLDSGTGERPINFTMDYRASWLAIGVLGSFACANADTWASELGTVLSSTDPWLITSGKKVPKGVNGGVSIIGLVMSFLGGLVIGIGYYLSVIYSSDGKALLESPVQWPVIPIAALAGFMGSLLDSVLGATLQYSGKHKKTGVVVEHSGPDIIYISGRRILDNNSVNFLSTIIIGLVTPKFANAVWPY